jgi:hypothetical protein
LVVEREKGRGFGGGEGEGKRGQYSITAFSIMPFNSLHGS